MKTLTAMKKYVISVGRQFGSGGHDIGKKLAERLGIKFYDKELLLEAAKEIGANPELFKKNDEKLPSFYINNLSMNLGFYMQPFAASPASSYYDSVQKTVCDTIRAIAERESCVIMGRCADFLLRHNPHCINIFIITSTHKMHALNESQSESMVSPSTTPKRWQKRQTNYVLNTTTSTPTKNGGTLRHTTCASIRHASRRKT